MTSYNQAEALQAQIDALTKRLNYLETHDKGLANCSCEAYNNAAISIASSGVWQYLTFNTEISDRGGFHSTVSNTDRFVVPTDGIYLMCGSIEFAANSFHCDLANTIQRFRLRFLLLIALCHCLTSLSD